MLASLDRPASLPSTVGVRCVCIRAATLPRYGQLRHGFPRHVVAVIRTPFRCQDSIVKEKSSLLSLYKNAAWASWFMVKVDLSRVKRRNSQEGHN